MTNEPLANGEDASGVHAENQRELPPRRWYDVVAIPLFVLAGLVFLFGLYEAGFNGNPTNPAPPIVISLVVLGVVIISRPVQPRSRPHKNGDSAEE
jgi:hypothetical protein